MATEEDHYDGLMNANTHERDRADKANLEQLLNQRTFQLAKSRAEADELRAKLEAKPSDEISQHYRLEGRLQIKIAELEAELAASRRQVADLETAKNEWGKRFFDQNAELAAFRALAKRASVEAGWTFQSLSAEAMIELSRDLAAMHKPANPETEE